RYAGAARSAPRLSGDVCAPAAFSHGHAPPRRPDPGGGRLPDQPAHHVAGAGRPGGNPGGADGGSVRLFAWQALWTPDRGAPLVLPRLDTAALSVDPGTIRPPRNQDGLLRPLRLRAARAGLHRRGRAPDAAGQIPLLR